MFEWLKRLFKKKTEEDDGDFDWDFKDIDSLKPDRRRLDLSDMKKMEEYVRACCEQMKDATEEIDSASMEFNAVTERLRDMEEIEALPEEVSRVITGCAKRYIDSDKDREWYLQRKDVMPEEQYHRMERNEADFPEAIDELIKNEEYKNLVRRDLKNLEGEKMSYRFRRMELFGNERTLKSLVAVIMFSVMLVLVALCIMQFRFGMDVFVGYLLGVAVSAVALTAVFIRYNNIHRERRIVEKKLNQAITVQNRVKIRYVNVTGLLDYSYSKYRVNSSDELRFLWDRYIKEKRERARFKEIDEQMSAAGEELLGLLKEHRVKKPEIWLRQAPALVDPREMVEIRHELVARRGSLRKRINYNEENRNALKEEEKQLVKDNPSMAPMIMEIVEEYE